MGPIDWLILALWVVTGVELGLEVKKKRWVAAGISGLVLGLLTWVAWPIFRLIGSVVASWF